MAERPHTGRTPIRAALDDAALAQVNAGHNWNISIVDADGRIVGGGSTRCERGWDDQRVVALIARWPLAGKRVLEPACFDGVMTCALCHAGANVTAFDVRPSCVAKTLALTAAFGFSPKVFVQDARGVRALGEFDVIFHSGLLYHLPHPAEHLEQISAMSRLIGLHTHTARSPGDAGFDASTLSTHEGYEGWWFTERPCQFGELAGIEQQSFWPTRTELRRLIAHCGLDCETVFELPAPDGWHGFYLLQRRSTAGRIGCAELLSLQALTATGDCYH
ncbi:MAG TPA: methyltransferase domain-containing protein [Pirellulales bacterium]|nr:methyltransferase domain-containing protein [Pirellulales bacterium]